MPIKQIDGRMIDGSRPIIASNSYLTNLTSVNVSSTNVFTSNIYVNNVLRNTNWDTAFTTVQANSSSWVNPLSSLTWSVSAPSLSSDPGIAGNVAYDLNFFYVAVSAGTWKRVSLSTF